MPEVYLPPLALLVVTDHEMPQQIVEWFVLERVLCGSDAERDVIGTRKCPRVTDPARQESNRCRRDIVCRQWRAITKRDFHVRRWQWAREHFRDAAVCAIGA